MMVTHSRAYEGLAPASGRVASFPGDPLRGLARYIAPLHARSSKLRDRADGQRPRWRTYSLGEAADGGTQPENDSLSWRPQRAPLGSALDADIYCLSRSDCFGSAPRFLPCQDRFLPKPSTPPPKRCTGLRPYLGDDLLRRIHS